MFFKLLFILFMFSGNSSKDALFETCDLIELNHFYDDKGKHAYDQYIFYEWSPDYRRFHVISWVLIDDRNIKFYENKIFYTVKWYDRDQKINREIKAKLYRETTSQIDPERANKKLLDEKFRRGLMKKNESKR